MGNQNSQLLTQLSAQSNFNHDELMRLRKRFMKLDKDQSGTIERDEFLSLPVVAANPLANEERNS